MSDDLLTIPGVGKSIAQDLREIGVSSVAALRGRDPEDLYERSCAVAGVRIDRCLLYTYRCAVYFAEGGRDPQKLKWWNWKDGGGQVRAKRVHAHARKKAAR